MSLFDHKFPPSLSRIYDENLANQLANTQGAIGSLNLLDRVLYNPNLLMHPLLGKEAESSSQLEGTQASIADAYKIDIIEQTEFKKNDAQEIRNYEDAMLTGLRIIEKLPLNNFVIREIHKTLLQGVRGKNKHPGEFRKGDAWIGNQGTKKGDSRYVAPDAIHVPKLMEELTAFINNSGTLHPLVACGVIHHRFEAIHPFEDGNGRTGRLIMSLFLIKKGLLKLPILYPSGYFEKNRDKYMDFLSGVDKDERWYEWLSYFLKGLEEQARLSLKIGNDIDDLYKESRKKIEGEKANLNMIKVLEYLFTRYYVTAPVLNRQTGIPISSCKRYLSTLAEKGVVADLGMHLQQRAYANLKLLTLLKNI
jgi:Fic family protein